MICPRCTLPVEECPQVMARQDCNAAGEGYIACAILGFALRLEKLILREMEVGGKENR